MFFFGLFLSHNSLKASNMSPWEPEQYVYLTLKYLCAEDLRIRVEIDRIRVEIARIRFQIARIRVQIDRIGSRLK